MRYADACKRLPAQVLAGSPYGQTTSNGQAVRPGSAGAPPDSPMASSPQAARRGFTQT